MTDKRIDKLAEAITSIVCRAKYTGIDLCKYNELKNNLETQEGSDDGNKAISN